MIVISIVDYKSADKTWDYILHFENVFSSSDLHFVVVDNSCDNENYKRLCDKIEGGSPDCYKDKNLIYGKTPSGNTIQVVDNQENAGYAKGNNLGYKVARRKTDFDYFIVSNNDLRIVNGSIDENLLKSIFSENDSIGLVGPCIEDLEGNKQSPCQKQSIFNRWIVPMLVYPFDRIFVRGRKRTTDSGDGFAYYVNGSFLIFKKSAFASIKGFDEGTFLFAEEPIVSERLFAKGLSTYFSTKIKIIHEHSAVIGNKYSILNVLKMRYTSDRYYYKKYRHSSAFSLIVSDISVKLFEIKYSLFHCLKNRRK